MERKHFQLSNDLSFCITFSCVVEYSINEKTHTRVTQANILLNRTELGYWKDPWSQK